MTDAAITRREAIVAALRGFAVASLPSAFVPAFSGAQPAVTVIAVYKDASCQCCSKWIAHLRASGFAPTVTDQSDMSSLKDSMGIPAALRSCHTAVLGKYLIEGHVPASDLRRLLTSAPHKVVGLAAPGMPSGSPGMEMPGRADRYDVIAFDAHGATSVFAQHG